MKGMRTLSLAAAVLAAAVLLLGTAVQQHASAQMRSSAPCATGFSQVDVTITSYECRTYVIKCPPRPGNTAVTKLLAAAEASGGVQFKYRCTYQPLVKG
jgi:hypothetical protein